MKVHSPSEIHMYVSLGTFLSGLWSSLATKVEHLAYPTYHPTEEFISVLKSYHLKFLKDISGIFTLFSLGGNFHKNTLNLLFPTTHLTCRPPYPLLLPSCYSGRDIPSIFPGCSSTTPPAFWGLHSESFVSPGYCSYSALFQHSPDYDSPPFKIFQRYFMALKLESELSHRIYKASHGVGLPIFPDPLLVMPPAVTNPTLQSHFSSSAVVLLF